MKDRRLHLHQADYDSLRKFIRLIGDERRKGAPTEDRGVPGVNHPMSDLMFRDQLLKSLCEMQRTFCMLSSCNYLILISLCMFNCLYVLIRLLVSSIVHLCQDEASEQNRDNKVADAVDHRVSRACQ